VCCDETFSKSVLIKRIINFTFTNTFPIKYDLIYISFSRLLGCVGGALASGMAVKMEITFYPDTLRDYTDYVTVESEGFTVKIPVEARRDPPQLNLPPTIDIGEILLFTGDF
jgi:hypothetical protein